MSPSQRYSELGTASDLALASLVRISVTVSRDTNISCLALQFHWTKLESNGFDVLCDVSVEKHGQISCGERWQAYKH
jgi:hypothetical protein